MTVSRRHFVASAAAVASFPSLLLGRTQDKPVVLGSGKHTYEWVKGWAPMPLGMNYGNTHGCIATDSKGNVYVNTDLHGTVVFDADGKFVKSWQKALGGATHGFTVVKEGDQEVAWQTHLGRRQLIKTDLDGKVLLAIDFPEQSGAYKSKNEYAPTSCAVAPNGDVYVGDGYGKSWVHQYKSSGEYIRSWGGAGKEPGKMNTPHGVWVDTRKEPATLIVADRGNSRLQIFDLEGKHLGFVHEGLRAPCHLAINGDGDVVVPDLTGRITLLDKENKLIAHLGEGKNPKRGSNDYPPQQWEDGVFTAPHCACWDKDGNILVQDWNFCGRWVKLKRVKP